MDIMAGTIYRLEPLKALFIQPILADMQGPRTRGGLGGSDPP